MFLERYAKLIEPEPMSGCWLWIGGTNGNKWGYGSVRHPIRQRSEKAHRLAYEMDRGPIPSGAYVCHRCDTPPCVNPEHLFLGTPTDNYRDCRSKGRWRHGDKAKGEQHHNARLKDADVIEIRRLYPTLDQPTLARRYGVTQALISNIVLRKGWRHL